MSWKVYGEVLESTDLTTTPPRIYAPIKITGTKNKTIKGIRTYVILYGTPTFTNLRMKIFNNVSASNTPAASVKAISNNSYANANSLLDTYAYGLKEIYFDFEPFSAQYKDTYHAALVADTYTKTENSFLAWRNIWPDPVYKTNVDVNAIQVIGAPIMITAVIGADL